MSLDMIKLFISKIIYKYILIYINMTIGNLIQLEAKGPEDFILYGNPQVTYFQQVYKRSTNFAIDYYKMNDNYFLNAEFGSTIKLKLPFCGDLLAGIYLKVGFKEILRSTPFYFAPIGVAPPPVTYGAFTLEPQFTSYINGIGCNFIEEVRLLLNGVCVDKLNGELIFLNNELHNSYERKQSFYRMIRYYPDGFNIGLTNIDNVVTYLHIPFFFTRDPSVYLPVCALHNTEISIEIKLKPLDKCLIRSFNYANDATPGLDGYDIFGNALGIVPPQYGVYPEVVDAGINYIELYMKNIFLDTKEQNLFKNKDLQYLIENLNIGTTQTIYNPTNSINYYIDLDFAHPTKYIFWVLQREDVYDANFVDNYTFGNNIQYGIDGIYTFDYEDHLLDDGVLLVNNTEITQVSDAIFLSSVQLYDSFRTGTDYNVYNYNFALNPCSHSPMGTLNFSKVLKKTFRLKLTPTANFDDNNIIPNILVRFYSHNFNVLVIKDGLVGLAYTL